MKSEHIDSPMEEKPYPVTTTSQETNKQPQDSFVEVSGPSSNNRLMTVMDLNELEILNEKENAGFCEALSSGKVKRIEAELKKKPALAEIKLPNGMLPIHMAASCGHRQIVRHLFPFYGGDKVRDLTGQERVQLFLTALENSLFDVANSMLAKCPGFGDEVQLEALHLLARKSVVEICDRLVNEDGLGALFELVDFISWLCKESRSTKPDDKLEFMSKVSGVLFDATKSRNFLIFEALLENNPNLLAVLDSKRRSLFHVAILYRLESALFLMTKDGMLKDLVIQAADDDGNNILHMAGMVSPHESFELLQPDILMQRDLLWYKEVEKRVPPAFKSMRNKDGHTPKDIFHSTHKELMVNAKHRMKDKANYGMLVATIIATIVFAASLAVPGHDVSPEASSLILQKHRWFIVFFVSNSVALFSSSASTIFFLTVLTSSYTEDEFNISLLLRLTSGVTSLFLAITTMVVAFIAACFLIFSHHSTWVAYLVASLGFSTVALFVFLSNTLFGDLFGSLYWSRYLLHSNKTNLLEQAYFFDQRLKLHEVVLLSLKEMAFNIRLKLAKLSENSEADKHVQEDRPAV